MEKLQGGLLAVSGYTGMQLTNDEQVPFAQEATFWYLTGIEFPNWWVIIDAKRQKTWLVEPGIDAQHRIFEESLLQDTARKISGINDIISKDEALSMLRTAARAHPLVHTVDLPDNSEHFGFSLNPATRELKDTLSRIFKTVRDFRLEIAKLRAIKQTCEIEWMQAAINLTGNAIKSVRETLPKYTYEYQIEADISRTFRYTGASGHAFYPIVSSGSNTATVHYFSNNSRLKKGAPLMLDIGARVNGYAADITRTLAVGQPTKRLEQIHAAVQSAQAEIIKLLKPGLSVVEYHHKVDDIMKHQLIELKLIVGSGDDTLYRQLFPHAVSHGLGIDVHEALGRPAVFLPGMVLTVEPGIYLQKEKFGVRIEDDILITDKGHKNLSAKLSTDL